MDPMDWMGRGWAFPPEFGGQSRALRMVQAEEDIEQALQILLSTSPGERIMQPLFGCGIRSIIFEPLDDGTLAALAHTIEQAVLFFEPRVVLDRVDIDTTDELEGVLRITLDYTISDGNSRGNLVYPFYFREARR